MALKPYHSIPIQDCGEPLVPIDIPGVTCFDPPPYQQLGADYQGRSPYWVRSGVLQALKQAQLFLEREQPGWGLWIFDAYRPIAVQQFMVDYTFAQILDREQLNPQELTDFQRQRIYEAVYTFWAPPSADRQTPPPHSTGAAIDVTLRDSTGQAVEMGGEIDELSPRSQPNYFRQCDAQNPTEAAQFAQYQHHRDILHRAMAAGEFLRHPHEWWHFSLGDQLWAWQHTALDPTTPAIARYGRVE